MEKLIDYIMNLFNVSESSAWIILSTTLTLLVIIIIVILLLSFRKKNKKENNKDIPVEPITKNDNKVEDGSDAIKENPINPINDINNKEIENTEQEKVLPQNKNEEIKTLDNKKSQTKVKNTKVTDTKEETEEKRQLSGKYEVFKAGNYYMYRLKASNGEILVLSEMYKTDKGAFEAIDTVKKNVEIGVISINEDKHGLWQFRLYSPNKRLLVSSAHYSQKDRCASLMESFKRFANKSEIVSISIDNEGFIEEIKPTFSENKKGGKIVVEDYNPKSENEFRLYASNGELMFTSIPYKTSDALISSINSLNETIKNGTFFITKDKKGSYQFRLYSKLGRNVFYSEAYQTKQTVISALNSSLSFVELAEKELPDKLIK